MLALKALLEMSSCSLYEQHVQFTWEGLHTRVHTQHQCRWASRGGSPPPLINGTPPLMTAQAAQKSPGALALSAPSIYLSIHPAIWTAFLSGFWGHFFISYTWASVTNSHLSVRLYTAKAHFSSCQDSVASSLNKGECGGVCELINQPVLFVIKVMGDRHICV